MVVVLVHTLLGMMPSACIVEATVFDAVAPRHANVAPTKEKRRTRTVQQATLAWPEIRAP